MEGVTIREIMGIFYITFSTYYDSKVIFLGGEMTSGFQFEMGTSCS